MRARLALIIWLSGILLPAVWLRQFSSGYRRAFDAVFGVEWTHIAAHLALFAILVILLMRVLRLPLNRRTTPAIVLAILAIGGFQEGFQYLSQGSLPLQPLAFGGPVFDLGVDLAGSLLGLGLYYCLQPHRGVPITLAHG